MINRVYGIKWNVWHSPYAEQPNRIKYEGKTGNTINTAANTEWYQRKMKEEKNEEE